jgi:hypothetical protein
MRGTLVPGGGDWEIVEDDGTAHLDTRYVMEVSLVCSLLNVYRWGADLSLVNLPRFVCPFRLTMA